MFHPKKTVLHLRMFNFNNHLLDQSCKAFSPDCKALWSSSQMTCLNNFASSAKRQIRANCSQISGRSFMYIINTDSRLHSKSRGDFITPRTGLRFTDRAFAVSVPSAWNSLPIDIRDCSSEATFKKHLKTYCFMQLLISISILLFSFLFYLIVLYGAVEHWMSGALVSLDYMIYDMMRARFTAHSPAVLTGLNENCQ